MDHVSTDSVILDTLISGRPNEYGVSPCPGWPRGRIIQLYGHESSGKTTVALHMAKSVIKAGGSVGYLDFENEIIPAYAKTIGIPIHDKDRFILCSPTTFEEGASIMWALAKAGVELIIVDSIPAAVPQALLDKTVQEIGERGQIGVNAAAWSAFLPRIRPICNENGTTLLGISQVRANIASGGYGPSVTVPGGNAWKFYSAIRMCLQKVKTVKAPVRNAVTNSVEDTPVGIMVKAKLDKCKITPQQGAESEFFIRMGDGIDNAYSLIEMAESYKIVKKDGSWYEWQPPNEEALVRAQGKEKLWKVLQQDPAKLAALERQLRPKLTESIRKTEVTDEDGDDDTGEDEDFQKVMATISGATAAAVSNPPAAASGRKSAKDKLMEAVAAASGSDDE